MATITMFLMGEKGLKTLSNVAKFKSIIKLVVGARDKNVLNDYYDDIKSLCEANNIPHCDKKDFVKVESEYSIAIAWRWMLPTDNKLIILHDSLLPKYRGFAPLVNMLINREPQIGVTAFFANGEFDRGDIIMQKGMDVSYPIKIHDAINLVSTLFESMVEKIFEEVRDGREFAVSPNSDEEATYSLWRNEDDYVIDWYRDAEYIQQFVYSVGYPYKGASTMFEGVKYRVLDCEIEEDVKVESRCPGKLLFMRDGCPVIVCGKGMLKITKLESDEGVSCLPMKKYRVWFK